MSTSHDPFCRFTHFYVEGGLDLTSPLFIRPEDVRLALNGEVHIQGAHWNVKETAEQIRDIVVQKLEENRRADTLGPT